MIFAVDTNILLDILIPNEEHMKGSKRLLETHLEKGRLVICEIVYAELSSQFISGDELDSFLSETGIRLTGSNEKSLCLAGERWRKYSKNRNRAMNCPQCSKQLRLSCPHCRTIISIRQRVLSDFIIGAHALVQAGILLSRDRGIYKTYFSDLKVLNYA